MTIIESLRAYFETFDDIANDLERDLNIDSLSAEAIHHSINPIGDEIVVQSFVEGTQIKQFPFIFASSMHYGSEVRTHYDNGKFHEDLMEFIETNNRNGILPILDNKRTAMSLKTTVAPQLFIVDGSEQYATYHMTIILEYKQKGAI